MRIRIAAATAAAMFGSFLAVGGASPAHADSAVTIDAYMVHDIVPDSTRKRIFFRDIDQTVAVGYDGAGLGKFDASTIKATPPVSGEPYYDEALTDIALAPAGSVLYAASPKARKILALNPATMKVTAEYRLGSDIKPYSLAVVGKRVWFAHYDGENAELAVLDLSGGTPVSRLLPDAGDWSKTGDLDVTPPSLVASSSGRLVVATSVEYASFDVSDGTPKVLSRQRVTYWDDYSELAITPDGERYLLAHQYASLRERRVSDHSGVRVLSAAGPVGNIAVAGDGFVAVSGFYVDDSHVRTFAPGTDTPIVHNKIPGGVSALAREPSGRQLFAFENADIFEGKRPRLHTIDWPLRHRVAVTLSGPATAERTSSVFFTRTLKSTLALPIGAPVTVTRFDLDSLAGLSLGIRRTRERGLVSFTDTPQAEGWVRYRIAYAGDATHAPSEASKAVQVSRAPSVLTLNNNGKVYGYGATATFTAHLGTLHKNRIVQFWVQPEGRSSVNRFHSQARVDSRGNATAAVKLSTNTEVKAMFTGDARYAPRIVKSVVSTKAPVSLEVTRNYRIAKIGGVDFKQYRKNVQPLLTVTMPADPDRAAYVRVEYYHQGKWQTAAEASAMLNASGRTWYGVNTAKHAGMRLRVLAGYRPGSGPNTSGDSYNYASYTSYQYLDIDK